MPPSQSAVPLRRLRGHGCLSYAVRPSIIATCTPGAAFSTSDPPPSSSPRPAARPSPAPTDPDVPPAKPHRDDRKDPRHATALSNVPATRVPAPPSGPPHTLPGVSPSATQLLSLNHLQRMLRRLPVGASASLFHYNELPSNVQRRVPVSTRERLRENATSAMSQTVMERGSDTNGKGSSGGGDGADSPRAAVHDSAMQPSRSSPTSTTAANSSKNSVQPKSFDADRLLLLHEPQLAPSSTSIYALFRRAVKERQFLRRQQQGRPTNDSGPDVSGGGDDDLRYLDALEEPCLLLPDTYHSFVALGLTADRATALDAAAASSPGRCDADPHTDPAARLDRFHLGLVTECTTYRVDYAAAPHTYILGVPTALLDVLAGAAPQGDDGGDGTVAAAATSAVGAEASTERQGRLTCPWRAPVDIARWVVHDAVSSQFLLRRRGRHSRRAAAIDPSHVSSGPSVTASSSSSCVSLLEEQVFLAHCYSFDPKNAYEAAAAAQKRRPPPESTATARRSANAAAAADEESSAEVASFGGYTLFFFHFARSKDRTFFGSVQNAGLLYPSCFRSYMTEVKTTQMLAADQAGDEQEGRGTGVDALPSSSRRSSRLAESPTYHAATSFFLPVNGKRFHVTASAAGGGGAAPATTSWTAQTNSYAQKTFNPAPAAPRRDSASPLRHSADATWPASSTEAATAANWSGTRDEESATEATQEQIRSQISNAFSEWKGTVTARVAAAAAASSPLSEATRTLSKAGASVRENGPSLALKEDVQCARAEVFSWEDRLDAEDRALVDGAERGGSFASSWERGWRLAPAPIAVAVPIVYDSGMSLRIAGMQTACAVTHTGEIAADGCLGKADVTVADAPLAEAMWKVLYMPPTSPEHSTAQPLSSSTPLHKETASPTMAVGGGAVLPLAEDRLSTARYRLLLPFLRTPRRVRPAAALRPSLLSVSEPAVAVQDMCCPALWHVDELEALCGWRRFRSQFLEPFGSFSALLNHDLYVALGSNTPAFSSFSSPRCGTQTFARGGGAATDRHLPYNERVCRSPVVVLNDDAYIRRVLLPAMLDFARHTSLLLKSGLYVYRGLSENLMKDSQLPTRQHQEASAPASSHDHASEKFPYDNLQQKTFTVTDEAEDVGVHHRLLVGFLQRLQRSPPEPLRAWLAEPQDDSVSHQAMSQRTEVPEACLAFFRERVKQVVDAAPAATVAAERTTPGSSAVAANLALSQVVTERVDALHALTPANIRVVPLLDFFTWASICSDFSAAARDELRCHAAAVRSKFTTQDCVMATKFCAQFPSRFCVEGGNGSSVALME
ncbi:hypothetical protein ABB37_02051 [Leptomonas pyrrhocoris]|uniref:Uncharacterized protein n=1 Tax=Leptomonas pyrrhocoris TaxID=157538 RepID=A0A0N0VGL0_LEPPY|nr:hypothetical protein ABB37_02051 [Leptomonas pyrrhocoris]KPA83854.1 hypothetical protein ABB37_02051 [Leptomonas pyrrhocoris]|eukprot:XP_015662293.1 hypothetical protein ABB37_02051 [Leptomonas pyrrhocoris]